MKRFPLIGLSLVAAALAGGGCSHIPFFSKRKSYNNPDKVSSHVATQVEIDFRDRWVSKRSGELVSQGLSPESATAQANSEFSQKFASMTIVSGSP